MAANQQSPDVASNALANGLSSVETEIRPDQEGSITPEPETPEHLGPRASPQRAASPASTLTPRTCAHRSGERDSRWTCRASDFGRVGPFSSPRRRPVPQLLCCRIFRSAPGGGEHSPMPNETSQRRYSPLLRGEWRARRELPTLAAKPRRSPIRWALGRGVIIYIEKKPSAARWAATIRRALLGRRRLPPS